MEYRKIEGLEKPISRMIYGTSTESMFEGKDASVHLDAAFECGINAFDTARGYQHSEESLGNWIQKRGNREEIVLITKCAMIMDPSDRITPGLIQSELKTSLNNLKTDHVDIFFLHKDDKVSDVGPILETLNEIKAKGKAKIFGTSNWTYQRMCAAQEYAYKKNIESFSVSQQCYSLLEQIEDPYNSVCLTGDKNKKEFEWYLKNQMPVFAYSSLARGFLSGKVKSTDKIEKVKNLFQEGFIKEYFHPENMAKLERLEEMSAEKNIAIPVLALAYLINSKLNVFPIMSPSSRHVLTNIRALNIRLSDEECQWLEYGD